PNTNRLIGNHGPLRAMKARTAPAMFAGILPKRVEGPYILVSITPTSQGGKAGRRETTHEPSFRQGQRGQFRRAARPAGIAASQPGYPRGARRDRGDLGAPARGLCRRAAVA